MSAQNRKFTLLVLGLATLLTAWSQTSGADTPEFSLAWSAEAQSAISAMGGNAIQDSESFIQTLAYLLPNGMMGVLARKFELDFGDSDSFKPIDWSTCPSEDLPASYNSSNLARLADAADAGWFGGGILYRRIVLNPDFKITLSNGTRKFRPSCRHGVDYNLALGAVGHELARAYDLMKDADTDVRDRLAECPGDPEEQSAECRQLDSIHRLVSDRVPFMHLMNFKRGLFRTRNKQLSDPDSQALAKEGDPRLIKNPHLAFASAVEDFLLEPTLYCDHPGLWRFLANQLQADGEPPACPQPFMATLYDHPSTQVELDPKRVYRLDYLYVHPGDSGIDEKFGHAMIRVVGCDPSRAAPGPECLADVAYHYVLTFYEMTSASLLQTLLGKGISRLYVYNYRAMLQTYVKEQHRPIEAVALALTPEQISVLVGLAWEWNQRYRGKWSDFSNNCVTQAMDLLFAAAPQLEFADPPFETPANVADFLQASVIYGGTRTTLSF